MTTRDDLQDWILEALKDLKGKGRIIDICRHVWENHENEQRKSGDLFFTWQYDMRWAGQRLRDSKVLRPANGSKMKHWELNKI